MKKKKAQGRASASWRNTGELIPWNEPQHYPGHPEITKHGAVEEGKHSRVKHTEPGLRFLQTDYCHPKERGKCNFRASFQHLTARTAHSVFHFPASVILLTYLPLQRVQRHLSRLWKTKQTPGEFQPHDTFFTFSFLYKEWKYTKHPHGRIITP